jgi:trans-aconitate methyltransferase
VPDIGCGHGHSTVLMAQAFPNSRSHGFDAHVASIEAARRNAAEAGVSPRTTFEVSNAVSYANRQYGLICFFDCLHDPGDPEAAARHAAAVLAPGGTVMLVEPFAHDRPNRTSTSWAACTTPLPPPFAVPMRSPRADAECSAHKPARRFWPKCSAAPASRYSTAPRRRASA